MATGSGLVYNVKHVAIDATDDGANTVIAGVSGKSIRVLSYCITATGAGTLTFQDDAGTPNVFAKFSLAANGGVAFAGGPSVPAFETGVGAALVIDNPSSVDALGHLSYQEIA